MLIPLSKCELYHLCELLTQDINTTEKEASPYSDNDDFYIQSKFLLEKLTEALGPKQLTIYPKEKQLLNLLTQYCWNSISIERHFSEEQKNSINQMFERLNRIEAQDC